MTVKEAALSEKSISRRHLVEFKVPDHFFESYYKKLSENGPVYAILSVIGNDSRIFFSPYKGNPNEFVSHVFFRKIDAENYLKVLQRSGLIEGDAAAMWPCEVDRLHRSYTRAIEKELRRDSTKKFHVKTSIFLHDSFREMEDFWVYSKKNMH